MVCKSIMRIISATVTFIIVFGLVGSENPVDEGEILDKLFTDCEAPTLTVFQTRAYLESLKILYSIEPRKFLSQAETSKYLEIAESSERASCFKEELYTNIEASQKSVNGRCNLVKFLEYHKQLYSERCNRDLSNAYLDTIAKIPREKFAALSKLTDSVKCVSKWRFNTKKPFYSDEALHQGIYNYLVEMALGIKVGEKADKCKIKIQKFNKFYKAKIVNLCQQADDEFKRMSKTLLDTVATSTKVLNSFDVVIRSWLFGGSICLDILDQNKHVETQVYFLYQENKPMSMLNCFFH